MRFFGWFSALVTMGTAMAVAAAVRAQEEIVLAPVSVTAKGHASGDLETPQSQITVTAEEIFRAGEATPGAVLRGRPGLAVQSDGAWGQNPVIRGLRKEQILILVDGIRLNSAQPQGAIASFVDPALVERIEVVKGPVSVLYGSGAMGGVVNFITRAPRIGGAPRVEGFAGGGASSVDDGFEGAAGVSLSGPAYGLALGVAARDYADYESPQGKVPRTGYRQQAGHAQFRWQMAPGHGLRVNAQRTDVDDVWYPGSSRFVNPLLGTATIRSPEQRRELYEMGYEGRFGGVWTPQLAAGVYRQEVHRQIRAFSSQLGRDYVRNTVDFRTDGALARLRLVPAERHLVLVGAEAWRMQASPERFQDTNPPLFDNNVRTDPFRDGEIRSAGVFVQDEILWDRWRLLAGARFDRIEGDAAQVGTGPAARTTGLKHTDDVLSWSLGAVYHLSNLANPYATVARAFRAADMRERFENATRGDGFFTRGNPQLDPEMATTVEGGIRGREGRRRYAVAAYRTEVRDYIAGRVTGAIDPGTGLPVKQTENVSRVVITGLEAEAEYGLGGPYYVTIWLSLQRGDNRGEDEPLFQMPPHEGSLELGARRAHGWSWAARLRLVDRQDRVATQFSNGLENPTPGFATLDLRASYVFPRAGPLAGAEVQLAATNLFDKAYFEHLTEGVSGQEILRPGRGFSVRVKGTF